MSPIRALLTSIQALHVQTRRMMTLTARQEELSPGLIMLLFKLAHEGPLRMTDISAHFGLTGGAVTGMTDKLEEKGLVTRVRSAEDRRIVQVELTEAGCERVERIRRTFEALAAQALTGVPERRLEEMSRAIHDVAHVLDTYLGGDHE